MAAKTVRVLKGIVPEGSPVAWYGNRLLYGGEQVEIPDGKPVPAWAELVKRPDTSRTLQSHPGRPVVDPKIANADARRDAESRALSGEVVAAAELLGKDDQKERTADVSPI